MGTLALARISTAEPTAGAAPSRSVSTFVSLARAGASGRFDELYRVEGPGNGIVEIAQEAPQRSFNAGSGRWSFVYKTQAGISSQWIQKGSASWDCWHGAGVTSWTCSGPGRFHQSNGFFLSVEPYIPGLVLGQVTNLIQAGQVKPDPVKSIAFFDSKSAGFGPLRCVKVDAIALGSVTSCLDRQGVLVALQGDSYWTKITLLKYRSGVPTSAFRLKGVSTSSGRNFTTVPN